MTEHTPGFIVEHARRLNWAWEVRYTNRLSGFAAGGRCYARCDSERDAQKIADSLNHKAAAPDLLAALERAVPWLGKLIADGGHNHAVCPQDAVGALAQAEAAIAAAKAKSQ